MSYLEKRGNCALFVAEVVYKGKRYRARFASKSQADKIEKQWRRGKNLPNAAPINTGSSPKGTERSPFGSKIDTAADVLWPAADTNPRWRGVALSRLRGFGSWLTERHGREPALDEVSKADLEDFQAHLGRKGLAAGTSNQYLLAVCQYLRWAHDRGFRGPVPRIEKRQGLGERTVTLDRSTRAQVVQWFRDQGQDEVADFWWCLFRTGTRRAELLTAKRHQLREAGLWLPKTKGKRERTIPLLPEVREVLERRLPWSLTVDKLTHWTTRLREAFGVKGTDRDFVLHTCRHTAATDMLERGVDIRVVQEILGHKSIQTTGRYLKTTPTRLKSAMEALR